MIEPRDTLYHRYMGYAHGRRCNAAFYLSVTYLTMIHNLSILATSMEFSDLF
jgi:hypothetical protein